MRLCIPFRVSRVSIGADFQGHKTASVILVPKPSEQPHDVAAGIWGNRYPPNGEVVLHGMDPHLAMEFEPGKACNVTIETL